MAAKVFRILSLILLVASLTVALIPPQPVSAQSKYACDELYYSNNDVLFFNPCDDVCEAGTTDATIKGVDNAEKIWNFYVAKGLKPVAIAGIIGNFSQESTLDPAVKQNHTSKSLPLSGDGVTGYGLAQWTYKSRQAGLFAKMKEAGLDKYLASPWGPSEKNREIPPEDLDKLLEVELNYSWDGDSTKISTLADRLNALTSVEGDNGSAVVFHNLYEGSADTASQIQERVADAKAILAKFGNSTASSGGACTSNLKIGGVKTLEDAIPWAKKYVEDTKKEYQGKLNVNGSEMNSGTNPKFVYNFGHGSGSYCWNAADCGQCVAMSGWFVAKHTTDESFLYENGGYIVDRYEAAGLPTGKDPRPFSVFSAKSSSAGHTGVVLGVLDNGEVITAEANYGSGGEIAVWQGNIQSRYSGKDLKFAYFDERLTAETKAAIGTGTPGPTAPTTSKVTDSPSHKVAATARAREEL